MRPTQEFYSLFQYIYDYFNKELFDNTLPNCMIVITRKTYTLGYYSNERWINKDNKKSDELAINPMYFNKRPLIEILQTVAHEMCHTWQFHHGKPSRGGYHNNQWGKKMVSIGLMPSNTGKPGGKKNGQQMMDYPIENGLFLKVCVDLIKSKQFDFLWYDRTTKLKIENVVQHHNQVEEELQHNEVIKINLSEDKVESEVIDFLFTVHDIKTAPILENSVDSSKSKYQCPNCLNNVWGKRNLFILCGDCDTEFERIE